MSNAAATSPNVLPRETSTADGAWHRRFLALASFVIGLLLGGLFWPLSRTATGAAEPWDAAGFYYSCCVFGAGFISTLVYSRSWVYGTLGVYLGQVTYLTLSSTPGVPQILSALLSVAIYGLLPALLGSLASFGTCKLLRMNRRRTKPWIRNRGSGGFEMET